MVPRRILASLLFFCAPLAFSSDLFDVYLTGNPADVSPSPSAGLLLEGGGGDVDTAFQWFLRKSGGGDIVILRASGADGYNPYIAKLAVPVDSVESFVVKTREASTNPELLAKIRTAEAIFFAGGDQWKYVSMWKGTPVAEAVNTAYARGVPVGGTSAGLAILGEHAFGAEFDGVTSAEALRDPFDKKVALESDFLHFPALEGWITDSHFSRRDRMGRLLVWLARLQASGKAEVVGIGIDEATAVMIEPDGAAQVEGKGSAFIVRLASNTAIVKPGQPLSGAQYRICRVSAGTKFRLNAPQCAGSAYTLNVVDGVVKTQPEGGSLYAAPNPWDKVKDLKSGQELRIMKRGSAQAILAKFAGLTEESLVVIVKDQQTAMPKDQIDRIDARPVQQGSRVTRQTTAHTTTYPDKIDGSTTNVLGQRAGSSVNSGGGLTVGGKPDSELIYRRQ